MSRSGGQDTPDTQEKNEVPVIKIQNGSFGWKKDSDSAIIRDINLDIMPGELTILVGPVGSGKTTLLESIVGESRLISGSVEVTNSGRDRILRPGCLVAEPVSQRKHPSLRGLFEELHDAVVRACQLDEDFRQFPKGDDSIIGSRGISLSGGQKQRVVSELGNRLLLWLETNSQSLRHSRAAVYNRKPVVLLDDVLKGLDARHSCQMLRGDVRSWEDFFGEIELLSY